MDTITLSIALFCRYQYSCIIKKCDCIRLVTRRKCEDYIHAGQGSYKKGMKRYVDI